MLQFKKNNIGGSVMKTLEYSAHNEDVSDYFLLSEAEKRMADNNDSENISHEQMLKELGITEKDLDGIDVEIEYIYSELEAAEKQVKQGKVLDADESLAQIKKKYNI